MPLAERRLAQLGRGSAPARSSGSSSCVRGQRSAVRRLPAEAAWRIASTDSWSRSSSSTTAAAAEHQGAVADVGHLLEVGGDHQDGQARARARRRAGHRSRPWRRRRRRPWAPPGSAAASRSRASGRAPPSAGCRRRGSRPAGPGRWAARRTGRTASPACRCSTAGRCQSSGASAAGGGIEEQVLAHAERHGQALAGAVAGDEADPGAHGGAGACEIGLAAAQADGAGVDRGQPEQRPADLPPGRRRAGRRGPASRPARSVKRDRADGADPQVAQLEHRGPAPRSRRARTPARAGGRRSVAPARGASSSATGLRPTRRPSRRTATSSATSNTSSRRCET